MITLRILIMQAIIAAGLSFMSDQAIAEANFDSAEVHPPHVDSSANGQVYIDNKTSKIKLSLDCLLWQVSLLHADTGVVTNNIEIDLIDKDGFVVETVYSFCMESKPFSLTLFRGKNMISANVREIKTLIVRTRSMGKAFCHGYGADQGEIQIVGEEIIKWTRTATVSEYLTLVISN